MASKQISPRQSIGHKIGVMMKQPTFDWGTEDKYSKLKNFKLEVVNVLKSYAITDVEKNSTDKELAGQKGLTIIRNINRNRTRKM